MSNGNVEEKKKSSVPMIIIIVVIIIISCPVCGIITAIAIPNFIKYSKKKQEIIVRQNADVVRELVEEYSDNHSQGLYPLSAEELEVSDLENPMNEYEKAVVNGNELPDEENISLEGCVYYYINPDRTDYIITGYGYRGYRIFTYYK